jgi:hypothetical protein
MFVRTIFLAGFLFVAGVLAIGTLTSGDVDPSAPDVAQPPASAIDEAATSEPVRVVEATPTTPPRLATREPTATTRPVERATPTAAPTKPSEATATASPGASERADFTGVWTVLYTITDGAGVGQSYSFDVSLEQNGRRISGGNDGIRVDGTAEGRTVTLTYRQPALGYTATFTWTLINGSWGGGAFTSAVNAGTSLLQRVR